jgi:hypothetical protein
MSIATLCPHCEDNHTCIHHAKVIVSVKDAEHDPVRDAVPDRLVVDVDAAVSERGVAHDMLLSMPGTRTPQQKAVCGIFAGAIETAIKSGVKRLTLVMAAPAEAGLRKHQARVLNCRAIHTLAYRQEEVALKEIEVVCRPEEKADIEEGLAASHPLCPFCFKPSAEVIPASHH